MKRILLVEDDTDLSEGLTLNLEAEGYEVVPILDGAEVMDEFDRGEFDLIVLDVMLPNVDGFSLCRKIRGTGSTVPILFLTARDSRDDKIEGLVIGGDDYLTKPFDLGELLARVGGMFRRQAWLAERTEGGDVYDFQGRRIDFSRYVAVGPHGEQQLSRRECIVMKYLVEREGQVVSRDHLLDAVWGYHVYPSNRTIDNFILKLRKILEDDPGHPRFLKTVRGAGYRFSATPDGEG